MNNKRLKGVYRLVALIGFILMVCSVAAAADDRKGSGDIKYLQRPLNAEDMLPLGKTQWLITSGLNGVPTNKDHTGHIYLINRKEKSFEELFPGATQKIEHDKQMFNDCPRPINHNKFSGHGLDLKLQSSGLYRLYIINHGEREAVEVFSIDVKGAKPAISWAGCVVLPKEVMANSVAILPDGGFLTTNYFDPTKPNSRAELIQGKISGAVYEWHPGGEVKAIKGTELSGPNGITLSPNNEWVYLTAFGTREVLRFNRTKSPVTMERVKVDITPDNIRWGDDGMLYTVGNKHVPPEECQNSPCRAGWSVYSVHPETLELKRIISVDQSAALQNGTTALAAGNEIWVGTFAGDRIAYFRKPTEPKGKTAGVTLEVLNPEAEWIMPSEISMISPRLDDLSNKKIGLLYAGKSGGEFFLDALEVLLKEKYPTIKISRYTRWKDNAEERIVNEEDAFVYAVGDAGQAAWDSITWTTRMEKLGKPGVAVFGDRVLYNAQLAANRLGMPSVRMVPLPSMEFYPNRASAETMMPCAKTVLEDIVNALTRPIEPSEINAGYSPKKAGPELVTITGDSFESAYENFYQMYMDNDWGDGLPLVPPTRHNVDQMLKATSLSPDTKLGTIQVHDGSADLVHVTVEKVAINAVMAGAKPEYFPVIIAAMEGLSDRGFSSHIFSSDGSFNLLISVSGPIAKQINMHSGTGLFGHGWRANNTIGRAVRLCMNNIGHLRPGKLDTALTGRASSHTFYVLAENDELSPWPPFHTVRGYRAEDSYVTVSGIGFNGDFTIYGGGTGGAWKLDGVLEGMIKRIAANRSMFLCTTSRPLNYIFILSPDTANELKKRGFTRQGFQDYIIDKTSVPYEDLNNAEIEGLKKRVSERSDAWGGTDNIPEESIPLFRENLKPGGKIPVVASPDNLNIFVSGDVSGYNLGAIYLLGGQSVKPVR